jgi:hypothetical protein
MESTDALTSLSGEEPVQKYVVKGDGSKQPLDLGKLRKRFENRSKGLNMDYINFDVLVAKLASGIYQGKWWRPNIPTGFG